MKSLSGIILFLIPLFCFAQEKDSLLIVKIETETLQDLITFKPIVQNRSSIYYEYNYLFLIKKTDAKNNLSTNKQSGKFTLEPQETKTLTSAQINQSVGQNIKAVLYIRDENQNLLIAKDSIEIKKINPVQVDEVSLLTAGIVTDDTKTRFGKEFYDAFFSVYNQYPKKLNSIIQIKELPFRGQTSIIQIHADQDLVYEFFSNPDEEITKQQVSFSLRKLYQHENQKEKLEKEFNY